MQQPPTNENAPIATNDQGATLFNLPADYAAASTRVKPTILPDDTFATTVPGELLELPNWILWKLEAVPGKAKLNKTPYQSTGSHAAVNNPAHRFKFTDQDNLVAEALRLGYSGLGFVLTKETPYTGVDLDLAVNPDGSIKPWAQAIVDRLQSYTERTPSGDGLRVWIKAKLGDLEGNKIAYRDGVVEFYDTGRYFTVTGTHLAGTPSTIEDRRFELAAVHAAVKAGTSLLFASALSPKIRKTMSGDLSAYNHDRSAAVAAVLVALAAVHRGNREEMRAEFEASELWRIWSDKWPRLAEKELDGAIRKWQEDRPAEKAIVDPGSWRELFHTYEQTINAPPLTFAIDGFLQEGGVTMLGGLSGCGKTLCALAMTRALLEGKPLFEHFKIPKASERVVYLIPECGLSAFAHRLKTFKLLDHVRDGRLFYRTLSSPDAVELSDPRLLRACEGADVFLDTAVRFMTGSENDASDAKQFADTLFALTRAGARTITGLHHSPKEFERAQYMSLENVLRGSGDVGAMLTTAWGIAQINRERTRLYIQNVKPRDFEPCEPFIVEGRPNLDRDGYFKLLKKPGDAGGFADHKKEAKTKARGGRRDYAKDKSEKLAEANRLIDVERFSVRMAAKAIRVDEKTLRNWREDTGHRDGAEAFGSADRPQ